MVANIVVGLIFVIILYVAGKKAFSDMKKGKCSGCSGCGPEKSCSTEITQFKA